jgi:hypothetical protein
MIFNSEFALLITIAKDIINMNDTLFGANINIILDTPNTATTPAPNTAPIPPVRPNPNIPTMRNRDIPATAAQQAQQNQQAINQNAYFDD